MHGARSRVRPSSMRRKKRDPDERAARTLAVRERPRQHNIKSPSNAADSSCINNSNKALAAAIVQS